MALSKAASQIFTFVHGVGMNANEMTTSNSEQCPGIVNKSTFIASLKNRRNRTYAILHARSVMVFALGANVAFFSFH